MTRKQAYQHGLLDEVNDRESLAPLLAAAGEKELVRAYIRGRIVGRKLKRKPVK